MIYSIYVIYVIYVMYVIDAIDGELRIHRGRIGNPQAAISSVAMG